MSLGRALRQLRTKKQITLAELAEHTGSYVGNLSRIERDLAKPSLDLLYRISEALGFSLSDIFSLAEPSLSPADPNQVALNTVFISLLEQDRELLLDFAKLLQERSDQSTEDITIDAKSLPADPDPGEEKSH